MADNITTDNLVNLDDLNPRNYLNDNSKLLSRTNGLDEHITFENLVEQTIGIAKSPTYNDDWNAGYIQGTSISSENEDEKHVFIYSSTEGGYHNRLLVPNDLDWSEYGENDFVKINSEGQLVPSDISVTDIKPTSASAADKFLQVSSDGTSIIESDFDFDSLLNYPDVPESNANTMTSGIFVAGYSTLNRPATGEQGYIISSRLRTDPSQTNPKAAQIFLSTDSDDIKFRRNDGTLGIDDFESWYTIHTDANHPLSDQVSSSSSESIATSNAVNIVNTKVEDLEARFNGPEILARLITVDGDGSELDADKLDGYQFSDLNNMFVNSSGDTITGQVTITGGNKIRYSNGTSFLDIKADSAQSTLDSNNAIGIVNGSQKQRLYAGGLLVSNNYTESSLIPTNGIYSKGRVSSATGYNVGNTEVADSNGKVSWNNLKDVPANVNGLGTASQRDIGTDPSQVPTNSLITNQLLPPGAVLPFAGTTAPDGWLVCDGSAISRTTYADLYAYIGTLYGSGDGVTTFNLPMLENQFIRGASATRPVGNEESDQIGEHEHGGSTDMDGNHRHSLPIESNGSQNLFALVNTANRDERYSNSHPTGYAGEHNHTFTTDPAGGDETRPMNVAMLYCIKY